LNGLLNSVYGRSLSGKGGQSFISPLARQFVSMMRSLQHTSAAFARALLAVVLLAVAASVVLNVQSQTRRTRVGVPTSFDDIVFGITFSPDGRTLAIARGAGDSHQQYGRLELWDLQTGKLRHVIKGFDGPVRSVSFTPDGSTLITGSTEFHPTQIAMKPGRIGGVNNCALKWWDPQTGQLKHQLTIPGDAIYAIRATPSPDGKQLAVRLSSGSSYPPYAFYKVEMKLLDSQTGDVKFKLDMGHPSAAAFSPDSKVLAVTNGDEVKLWDTQTGRSLRKLKDLRGSANAVAFTADGKNIAVASTKYSFSFDNYRVRTRAISEVKVFEAATGNVSLKLPQVGIVNSVTFSQSGRILLVGGVLPTDAAGVAGIRIFDLHTGNSTDLPTGGNFSEAVDSLALSGAGEYLAFRSGPATVKVLETRTGQLKYSWDADSLGDPGARSTSRYVVSVSRMLAVAFSPDGLLISAENDHGEIKSWDHRTGEVKEQVPAEQDDPSLVAVSGDGKSFAEISEGELLLWNANSDAKRPVHVSSSDTSPITALAISADGQTVALAAAGEVTLVKPSGEVAAKMHKVEGTITRLTFSPDGRSIAGANEGGGIFIWNAARGQVEKTLANIGSVTAMAFGPNGAALAVASEDKGIAVWNLASGNEQLRLQKHEGVINALAFSPDGRLLASGGDDRMIVLWELAGGKSKQTLKGHDQTVTSLAFSPNGELLASGSGNASVVLWEVVNGRLNRVLK
jgi:WD40 repeat protein